MKIKDRAKPRVPTVEGGMYLGICIGAIDLGEQYSDKYKTYSNKLLFVFEFPTETIEVDGKQEPKQLSREFNITSKVGSKFRDFISAWNGKTYSDDEFKDLEIFDQLGKACQLNVVLNEAGDSSKIETAVPLMKGMVAPPAKAEFIKWDMDAWDDELFKKLPEWVQEKIKKSTQYQKDHAPNTSVEVKSEAPAGEGACPI